MKIIYAFRRTVFYPQHTGSGTELPPGDVRVPFLRKVKEMGFEGLELGVPGGVEREVRDQGQELKDVGLPCVAVRGGGPSLHPRSLSGNSERMAAAVRAASWIGAEIVNASIGMPRPSSVTSTIPWGEAVSWGCSRDAREEDFRRAAEAFRDVAPLAEDLGVKISIEIHQHCLVDNSWSGRHLMELIDHPSVGLNPDLGNVYWIYDIPEESCEAAVVAMAPHAHYWHMKNLIRTHIPQHEHAIFLQVPLPDGDIDYRFALSAMIAAGYSGPLAIEGLRLGDQVRGDARSVTYIRELLEEISG